MPLLLREPIGLAHVGRLSSVTCILRSLSAVCAVSLAAYLVYLLNEMFITRDFRAGEFGIEDYTALLYFGPGSDPLVVTQKLRSTALSIDVTSDRGTGTARMVVVLDYQELKDSLDTVSYRDGPSVLKVYVRPTVTYPFTTFRDVVEYSYDVATGGQHYFRDIEITDVLSTTNQRGNCTWPDIYGGNASIYNANTTACVPGYRSEDNVTRNGTSSDLTTITRMYSSTEGKIPDTVPYFYTRFFFFLFMFALFSWILYSAAQVVVALVASMDPTTRVHPERIDAIGADRS